MGTRFAPFPEPPFHHVAADGSRIVLADWSDHEPEQLHVRVFQPDGVESRSFSLSVPADPVPAATQDSLIAAAREHIGGVRERVIAQGISAEQAPRVPSPAEVREQAFLPDHRPPVQAVHAGTDDTIWLWLADGAWVALDSDGAPLFRVRLPEGASFRQGSRTAIWGTWRGEYDIPYVARWEVEGGRR